MKRRTLVQGGTLALLLSGCGRRWTTRVSPSNRMHR
jgi:hypothetical protein